MADRLLLFDIDGTLLTTGGAGKRAFNQACAELAGIAAALDGVVLDGATDKSFGHQQVLLGFQSVTAGA